MWLTYALVVIEPVSTEPVFISCMLLTLCTDGRATNITAIVTAVGRLQAVWILDTTLTCLILWYNLLVECEMKTTKIKTVMSLVWHRGFYYMAVYIQYLCKINILTAITITHILYITIPHWKWLAADLVTPILAEYHHENKYFNPLLACEVTYICLLQTYNISCVAECKTDRCQITVVSKAQHSISEEKVLIWSICSMYIRVTCMVVKQLLIYRIPLQSGKCGQFTVGCLQYHLGSVCCILMSERNPYTEQEMTRWLAGLFVSSFPPSGQLMVYELRWHGDLLAFLSHRFRQVVS